MAPLLKSNRQTETPENGFIFSKQEIGKSSIPESEAKHKMPTVSDMVVVLKNMGEDSLAEALSEAQDAMKKAGYKAYELDITAPSGRFNPFSGVFDVFGDKRKTFVEKLADIFAISVIEEDDIHIRFAYTEKNYVCHSEYELQKAYADYVALWESVKGQVGIVAVDYSMELLKRE